MEKTSLEKSHSKLSNTKLTLLCLLTSCATTGVFGALTLFNFTYARFFTCLCIGGGICLVLSILCLLGLKKFVR